MLGFIDSHYYVTKATVLKQKHITLLNYTQLQE